MFLNTLSNYMISSVDMDQKMPAEYLRETESRFFGSDDIKFKFCIGFTIYRHVPRKQAVLERAHSASPVNRIDISPSPAPSVTASPYLSRFRLPRGGRVPGGCCFKLDDICEVLADRRKNLYFLIYSRFTKIFLLYDGGKQWQLKKLIFQSLARCIVAVTRLI